METEHTSTQVPYSSALPSDSKLQAKYLAPIPRNPDIRELANIKRLESNALWLAIGSLALTMSACGLFGLVLGPAALSQARLADRAHLAFHGKKSSQHSTRILAWASILLPTTIIVSLLFYMENCGFI